MSLYQARRTIIISTIEATNAIKTTSHTTARRQRSNRRNVKENPSDRSRQPSNVCRGPSPKIPLINKDPPRTHPPASASAPANRQTSAEAHSPKIPLINKDSLRTHPSASASAPPTVQRLPRPIPQKFPSSAKIHFAHIRQLPLPPRQPSNVCRGPTP